ncbi:MULTISPECIES: DOMON-like domain-containing protein [Nostocales]|uniref:DOMON-like domain-containing protein n=3 Tax=Nostocales TaxID=1161 RepID=A0A0C1N9B4_9CYAN|nr:DOMON-like domain-containing protein [Tolypothrix bouteillei]KAF3885023.1 DOMON-like domain-containing protein [Tolypothrix bouteillei VB521301]
MQEQTFFLQPFSYSESLSELKIKGNVARYENEFTIQYALLGDLTAIEIADPSDEPKRKHELWQNTCFEFFLGIENSDRYWEFNISPSGDWNVYRFDAYRHGMQEENAFTALPFSVQYLSDGLALVLNVDLDCIISTDLALKVGISTVMKHKDGSVTYWALKHTGDEPDFHRRDSFTIEF